MNNIHPDLALECKAKTSPVVVGCIETLSQGYEFLERLSDDDYVYVAQPHVSSSIGEHYRHWIDLFQAIQHQSGKIDYNVRRRGHRVERNISLAKQEIAELIQWLFNVPHQQLNQNVCVEMEMMLSQTHSEEVRSTLARELTFATLHATHHFAMAKVVASLCGVQTQASFGVAPATASYQRAQ